MASGLIEILNDLDSQMLQSYNDYASHVVDTWENFQGNPGQMAIVENHVLELVQEHVDDAKDGWPYGANPETYLQSMYAAFDPEVMDRAFSDTIEGSYSTLYEYWSESMEWQSEHESIMAAMGTAAGPHSTADNWSDG